MFTNRAAGICEIYLSKTIMNIFLEISFFTREWMDEVYKRSESKLHMIVFDIMFYLVMVYLLTWEYEKASFELSVTNNIQRKSY